MIAILLWLCAIVGLFHCLMPSNDSAVWLRSAARQVETESVLSYYRTLDARFRSAHEAREMCEMLTTHPMSITWVLSGTPLLVG